MCAIGILFCIKLEKVDSNIKANPAASMKAIKLTLMASNKN